MPESRKGSMVPIRVDRLRAAQGLDGRSWPDIARALKTTHQRLYHLTTVEGPVQRRCRERLRDGFASLFDVPAEWLSGQTDALRWVLTADATVVNLSQSSRVAQTRVSMLTGGAGHDVPGLQLALERLLGEADRAVARDFAAVHQESIDTRGFSFYQIRELALYLVSLSVEFALDLVQPPPPVEEADAVRVSGVRYMEQVYRPWFEAKGRYPEWRLIIARISTQIEGGLAALLRSITTEMVHALVDVYEQLRAEEDE